MLGKTPGACGTCSAKDTARSKEHLPVEETRDTDGQDIDHRTADDLIHFECDR